MKDNLKVKLVRQLALTALLLVLGVVESVATEPVTSAPAARPTEDKEAIPQVGAPRSAKMGASSDEMGSLISGILGEIDDRWSEVFSESGQTYTGPKIVLFRNVTNGGRCGMVQSATGPFYCPPDQKIFLDTGVFREIETRLNGCSDNTCKIAAAYIIAIAREAGHHVQNLLGILPRVARLQQQASSKAEANALQVRVELQADCLAGLWVNREEKKRPGFLKAEDIEAVLTTASALGDDTHGSAAQRKQWFMIGYQQGLLQACNTFAKQNEAAGGARE
jgi:predicted metalloprotease